MNTTQEKAKQILAQLLKNVEFGNYIDTSLDIPLPYIGKGPIKLIILGQDPTIKDITKRSKIKTVLNLDRNGSARAYLAEVCLGLGIDLGQNVYATNLFKNFFTSPPTEIEEINLFQKLLDYWLPVVLEELSVYADVPVITLGEPILYCLLKERSEHPLREHWRYTANWKREPARNEYRYVSPESNWLGRVLFPFPHQPSLRTKKLSQKVALAKRRYQSIAQAICRSAR